MSRQALLTVAVALLGIFLPCYSYDLRLPDEPRVAHTAFEMLRTGDFVLPRVNGEPFLQTPPGYYAALGLVLGFLGPGVDGHARLLSWCFTCGTLMLTGLVVCRHYGASAALLTLVLLAATFQFWEIGHRVVVEAGLGFFLSLALVPLAATTADGRFLPGRAVVFGVAAGFAFLCKGLPALVWLVSIASWTLVLRSWVCGASRSGLSPGETFRPANLQTSTSSPSGNARQAVGFLLVASAVAASVVAPWWLALYLENPDAAWELVFHHVLRRIAEGGVKNPDNLTFLHRTLANLLPWTALLIVAIPAHARLAWRGRSSLRPTHQDSAGNASRPEVPVPDAPVAVAPRRDFRSESRLSELFLLWALLPVLFLLVSRSKRQLYLFPALPAFAILAATWLDVTLGSQEKFGKWCGRLVPLAAVGAIAGFAAQVALAFDAQRWVSLGAAVLLAVCGAAALLDVRGRGRDRVRLGWLLAVLISCSVSFWGTVYHMRGSAERGLSGFGGDLRRLEAEGYEVIGYRLSEREVGAIAWYLRHPFAVLEDLPSDAHGQVPGRKPLFVMEAKDLDVWRNSTGADGFEENSVLLKKELRRRALRAVATPSGETSETVTY